MSIFFGCVADDFTGASDGASFLVKAGVSTILVNGIPEDDMPEISSEAVVIALKSRTQNTEEAVADCIKAFQWLIKKGAKVLYFKYCSTFDSTDDGNIGPVIDAVLEKFNYPYTVLCPSLPVNGRTVKNGKLYVYGKLLEESSMKDHPITPMRHSRLSDLMKKQGKYRCLETSLPVTEEFFVDIKKEIDLSGHCYLVPDYENDKQGAEIVNTFPEIGFYTGGSGLMEHLAKKYVMDNGEREKSKIFFKSPGKACILAGSCSEATLSQIEYFQKAGLPTYKILPEKIIKEELNSEQIWKEAAESAGNIIFIYSSASVQERRKNQHYGKKRISQILEKVMADLAKIALDNGIQKIIVAGGETSGAVIKALKYQAYWIGESVAPGVPVMTPIEFPEVRLVLKSGNFGKQDFFIKAIKTIDVHETKRKEAQ